MSKHIKIVREAIEELKQGRMVILTDAKTRENEGDLIIPAECITPQMMNFMIRNGTGIVCITMPKTHLQKLNLPLMVPNEENTSESGTPFTISVDARDNITTGVSAQDRVTTVLTLISDEVTPEQIVRPGHLFPLQARDGGVFERAGHTEGALDLVKLAGFKPFAVICEIMNPDGSMACDNALTEFATTHQLKMLSIEDILQYRYAHENLIADEANTILPLENYGEFDLIAFKEKITGFEHVALFKKSYTNSPTLVRIHSACTTGDLFHSERCDCYQELHYSLQKISDEGGVLIYLNQEGRGIGLFNKIKAYALQDIGYDTVEANEHLGLPVDARCYAIAGHFLRNHGITQIRLLTNNPDKVNALQKLGFLNITREPLPIFSNPFNYAYLKTKIEKLFHSINLDQ